MAKPVPYADDKDVLQLVADLEKEGLLYRQQEEYAWMEAWRFYNGKHWSTWTDDGRLIDIESDDRMPRIVLNFILNMVQTRLGHLIKNRPVLQGMPGTPDEDSRNATKLAVQAILANWRKLRLNKKLAHALLWALVTGKCFWKIWWDPLGGKTITEPGPMAESAPEGAAEPPMEPPEGALGELITPGEGIEPIPELEDEPDLAPGMMMPLMGGAEDAPPPPPITRKSGELCVELTFPHEVLVAPGSADIEAVPELLHVVYWSIKQLLDQELISDDEAKQLRDGKPNEDEAVARSRRQLEDLDRLAGLDMRGKVPVKEVWAKPNDRWPKGLWAIVVNGKVRKSAPLPEYLDGQIPFVEFDEIKTNGFWSTSTARQLMDLNRIVNIEISQQENVRRVLRYKTLIPEQAQIDSEAMDDDDSEVINYWAPFAPSHLKPPEINASHVEIRNSLISMMKEIGGNWDILAGKTEGEVRSGRQTAYLQEYAGTVLGIVSQQVEWALQRAGNMMLRALQENARDEQLEAYVGPDRRIQVFAFKGADLKGCNEIIIQPGSALPISRTERWDRVERWMEKGWLDPTKGLRLLDLGDYDQEIYGEEEQDRQNADENIWKLQSLTKEEAEEAKPVSEIMAQQEGMEWSLRYLLRVLTIEAFPFDNHELHINQIDKALRKTRAYRAWPSWQRALADELVEWHSILADPTHGPIETPIGGMPALPGATLPPGTKLKEGESPQEAVARMTGGGGGGSSTPEATGGPSALNGKPAPGEGGVGDAAPYQIESGQERAEGLPGVPRPPGPGTA